MKHEKQCYSSIDSIGIKKYVQCAKSKEESQSPRLRNVFIQLILLAKLKYFAFHRQSQNYKTSNHILSLASHVVQSKFDSGMIQ